MSHVATIDIEITNLQDLQNACADLGLEFVEGQQTYNCYHSGQSPDEIRQEWESYFEDAASLDNFLSGLMPSGFALTDVGKCDHAIRLKEGRTEQSYEIGVARRRDGKPGWCLLWDEYDNGGYDRGGGLKMRVGISANRLKQAVATAASVRVMKAQGYRCHREQLPNGTVKLKFARG